MPSNIKASIRTLTSDNEGSIVGVTVSNNGAQTVGPLVVTAIYQGDPYEYIWSENIATLPSSANTVFNLSINNEIYTEEKLHIGVGFKNYYK